MKMDFVYIACFYPSKLGIFLKSPTYERVPVHFIMTLYIHTTKVSQFLHFFILSFFLFLFLAKKKKKLKISRNNYQIIYVLYITPS